MHSWNVYEFINMSNYEREKILSTFHKRKHCFSISPHLSFLPFSTSSSTLIGLAESKKDSNNTIRLFTCLGGNIAYTYKGFGIETGLSYRKLSLFSALSDTEQKIDGVLINLLVSLIYRRSYEFFDVIFSLSTSLIQIRTMLLQVFEHRHIVLGAEFVKQFSFLTFQVKNMNIHIYPSLKIAFPFINVSGNSQICKFNQIFVTFKANFSIS